MLLLLLTMGLTLAWSVEQGNWVETPGLVSSVVAAVFVGLVLAKLRLFYAGSLLAGLALGFVMVVWQATSLTDSPILVAQVQEIWHRVQNWTEAAIGGGISIDLLPFSLILLTIGWLLGFLSSWVLFRHSNVWGAIIPMAVATLTNLSYMPSDVRSNAPFFFFLLAALLLVIRMNTFRKEGIDTGSRIDYGSSRGWATMSSALWFSITVVALTAFLPIRGVSYGPLTKVWTELRSPAAHVESEFARLMSGISGKNPRAFRIFGDNLPFQGRLTLSSNVALWVQSQYSSYWTSRTYAVYTSQGWLGAEVKPLEVGGDRKVPPPPQEAKGRIKVAQEVQVGFDTELVFAGGNLTEISKSAVVNTLASKSFTISIEDTKGDASLPADIQELASVLRAELSKELNSTHEVAATRLLNNDLVLEDFQTKDDGGLSAITISRKDPILSEVVSSQFSQRLLPGELYTMVSSASLATNNELSEAGTEYPTAVTDYYLQLPDTLSPRVKELSQQLTTDFDNAHDKALTIQNYLREFKFTLNVDPPPFNADGVTHFLFNMKEGYGDYFASAMAVMLRTIGIPARIAVGYSPGIYDSDEAVIIMRDSDSHAWTQVYFPQYGWIDFEPTPNKPLPARELLPSDMIGGGSGGSLTDPEEEDRPDEDDDLGLEFSEDTGLTDGSGRPVNWLRILSIPGLVLLALGVVTLALWTVWNRSLATVPVSERTYVKMIRLATLAVAPRRLHETPSEYADAIAQSLLDSKEDTETITNAFLKSKYGKQQLVEEEQEPVEQAWNRIRKILAWGMVKRFFSLIKG